MDKTQKFSIIFGKKQINLYKDSGISGSSCVKMYMEYYLTLPGGFRLPLGIAVETVTDFDTVEETVPDTGNLLALCARSYLQSHMIAGQILDENITVEGNRLFADYICLESIGQNQYEEFTRQDGEIDGENG